MSELRQTSFAAGELDPLLWGRTELGVFRVGARTLRNFFVSKQGTPLSRPGTEYVAESKSGSYGMRVRLVTFQSDGEQDYVIEFGFGYLKILQNLAYVEAVTGGHIELGTPYAEGELAELKLAQVGDVMTVVHPSHAPRELKRLGHQSWTFTAIDYDVPSWPSSTFHARLKGTAPTLAGDSAHPAREWLWVVTMLLRRDADGVLLETRPLVITRLDPTIPVSIVPAKAAVYSDRAVEVVFDAVPSASALLAFYGYAVTFVGYHIYRGRKQLLGWVGLTDDDAREFVDVGEEPDYSLQPPRDVDGADPFRVNLGAQREEPASVAFFEERRIFGGTAERPAWLFASRTGDYNWFRSQYLVHRASEPLFFELASQRRERIRHLLSTTALLTFTDGGVWSVRGQQTDALMHDSIDARVVNSVGANHVPPLIAMGLVLYTRSKGNGVVALAGGQGDFETLDVSASARHLVVGAFTSWTLGSTPVVVDGSLDEWGLAEDPWGVVWAVRDDGKLLSFTPGAGGEAWGWARHDTDGEVISLCVARVNDEDRVYLAVQRTIGGQKKIFIERMTSRVRRGTTDDDVCLDCAIKVIQVSLSKSITGLGTLEGKSVWVVGKDNPPQGPFTVTGGAITLTYLPTANSGDVGCVLWVGLKFLPQYESLDAAEPRMREKNVVKVGLEVVQSKGLYVGPSLTGKMVEWQQRTVAAAYNPPSAATDLVEIVPPTGWSKSARIAVEQRLPLPVTLVAVTRELEGGG